MNNVCSGCCMHVDIDVCMYAEYMSNYYDMLNTDLCVEGEIPMYMYILERAPPLPKRSGQQGLLKPYSDRLWDKKFSVSAV